MSFIAHRTDPLAGSVVVPTSVPLRTFRPKELIAKDSRR
jgi:hypothetical protein